MKRIVGIDEVGRGCWAGPLVAAAVVLASPIEGLRDSKKLSKKRREALAALIHEQAEAIGIGWVAASEVDELGLTKAVQLAMLRAIKRIETGYDEVIIDGNTNFFKNVVGLKTDIVRTIVRADDTVPAVSAASIVAKVARDTHMTE
ncbi:ribonuclease HII, partial [Candidatus Saccharibacteria bacterium]|nr:ribonuclease HII [Candidatus Saccharibacteria bacterium]